LGSNEALNLIRKVSKQMPKSFHSNSRLLTSLLDALMKCGDITDAESLFNSSIKNDSGMYGAMMNGYNKNQKPSKTLDLFNHMKRNEIVDKDNLIIYLCVIKALSQIGDYLLSQSMIEQIPNDFLINNQIQTALIDMWVSLKRMSFNTFSCQKEIVLF
jgi:pentatricopeptide repeat protein